MVKTAFSTLSCPDWTYRQIVELGKQFGFDGVEIRQVARETDLLKVPEFQPTRLSESVELLRSTGFEVRGLASSVRFDAPQANVRDEQVEIGKANLDLAKALGASFVRVFGDVVPDAGQVEARRTAVQHIADGLQRLGEYAVTLDLDVVIETHGDFADSRLMQETMNLVESPAVGVLWDTHHPWRFYGETLAETFTRIQPWVRHTHWKDSISKPRHAVEAAGEEAASAAHQLMSGHQHADYVLFRGGEFPALECMRLLRDSGYAGWYSLEWEKMWHPDIEDPEIALPLFPPKMRELWHTCLG